MKDEPLHLAVQFSDPKHTEDLVLVEVLGGFGGGQVDPDRRFMEVEMPSSAIPLNEGGKLRLVLTSPEELRVASQKGWKALARLRGFKHMATLSHDKLGKELLPLLVVK
jgi:hypothetical protein